MSAEQKKKSSIKKSNGIANGPGIADGPDAQRIYQEVNEVIKRINDKKRIKMKEDMRRKTKETSHTRKFKNLNIHNAAIFSIYGSKSGETDVTAQQKIKLFGKKEGGDKNRSRSSQNTDENGTPQISTPTKSNKSTPSKERNESSESSRLRELIATGKLPRYIKIRGTSAQPAKKKIAASKPAKKKILNIKRKLEKLEN